MTLPTPSQASLTRGVANFALRAGLADFSADVTHMTKLALLDGIGCGVAGAATEVGRKLQEYVLSFGSIRQSTVLASSKKAAAPLAALANSVAIGALDYDDIGPTGQHPGCAIVPGVLAAAEETNANGSDLLDALFVGYEVAIRLGLAIAPTRARGWQGISPTYHGLAVAAAAARLYGLTAEQTADALGIAGATASVPFLGKFGWDIGRISWLKDGNGPPAETGVRAAALSRLGLRGPPDVLDGDTGFWAMVNSDRFQPGFLEDYSRPLILDLGFKRYPTCRLTHSALDAFGEIRARTPFRSDEVQRIEVGATTAMATNMVASKPSSAFDAQFNVRYAFAASLLDISFPDWYTEATLKRADIEGLMSRINVSVDEAVEQRYRAAGNDPSFVPAMVLVTLDDGRQLEEQGSWARGSPQRPLTDEELYDKFDSLLAPQMGLDLARSLRHLIMSVDAEPNLSRLSDLLACSVKEGNDDDTTFDD